MADSFESDKKEILDSLKPVEKQLEATNTALLNLDKSCDDIVKRKAVVEAEIKSAIDEAHRALDARREEVLAELEEKTQQQLNNVSAQRETVETIQTQRNSCLHFVRESIRTGSPGDVLKMKAGVMKQVEELVESFDPSTLKPCEQANARFIHSDQLVKQCQEFGEIASKFSGKVVKTIDGVKRPQSVAINKSGEVVVAERDAHQVTVFNPAGDKIRTITGQGLNSPYGLAVDRDDNILVTSNYRLLKFSSKGDLIATVGSEGDGPGQFKDPLGITVNSVNGKVYVVDSSACCVHVFNSDLTFSSKFASKGYFEGQLKNPWHIAADSSGCVYVTDYSNSRIQVFTADGHYLREIGSGEGELSAPLGICIDGNDLVYVSDTNNYCVSVFTSEGELVKYFGSKGTEPGQFNNPHGVAVDSSGVVYVCDLLNNRMQFFK